MVSHEPPDLSRPPAQGTAIERLASLAWALRRRGDAAAWRERAAWHLLDWLGNAACGALAPQGQVMRRWLALQARGEVPTLAGRHADAAAAAAYHGALGSALEMDDVHRSSVLHPGPVVLPALLAAGTAATSATAWLDALVIGYEVMVRIGRALGPSHYEHWHPTATAGSFAAAAAAASVMGLDAARAAQALALAGTRAGGLWQVRHESQLGKAWHMAGAAREGFTAAQLAACGMTGPLGVLDGPSGWFAATAPDANPSALDEPRDEPWIADVSFKPWPACRHAHPAMDALRVACGERWPAAEDIERIDVHGYADAQRFCDRATPLDEQQARFSIQHALAAWLVWGEPRLEHYRDEALIDARVAALRARIVLHTDAAIDARYPAQYGARLTLLTRDGRTRQAELQDTYGDPARPMSPDALVAKARLLMRAAGWTDVRVDAAIAACLALPGANDLVALHAVINV